MTVVVDASIVVRFLQNRSGDHELRSRIESYRELHAPGLIDAEVTSAIRGLLRASAPGISIDPERADEMIIDYADLPLLRYPMAPYQRRVIELRHSFTAYHAFCVALAESLGWPVLTDDTKFAGAPGTRVAVETWPRLP